MLRSLCEYYDCLLKQEDSDLVPEGYSKVGINYNIVLSADGKLKEILDYTNEIILSDKKTKNVSRKEIFPFRNAISSISAETIDHRGKYIFGFDWNKKANEFETTKSTLLAFEKSKTTNLNFLDEINTPVSIAYKNFLKDWNPERETQNPILLRIGKEFSSATFVITVEDNLTYPLNSAPEIIKKWEMLLQNITIPEDAVYGQCSISGEYLPIARIHDNLKGINGGMAIGVNIVCFKNTAYCSYGKEQSYNSNVSVKVMKKYTRAFNYLSSSNTHKQVIDDMTLLYWAKTEESEKPYLDVFEWGCCHNNSSDEERAEKDRDLEEIFNQVKKGNLADLSEFKINLETEFYVLGVKPNSSRLAIKLFEHNTFGTILDNIARHVRDMSFSENDKQLSIWVIVKSLKSPVSDKDTNPEFASQLILSIIKGYRYPKYMLDTVVRRAKTDQDDKKKKFESANRTRARIIKGCLIRNQYIKEGEYNMLNEQSTDTAYNLGRLFALLEKIQYEALGDLNATIKNKFFSSACTTPNLVFPKLLRLAQPHLEKLESWKKLKYEKLLEEIMAKFDSEFSKTLNVEKQGLFILGYYHQKQKFYEKAN